MAQSIIAAEPYHSETHRILGRLYKMNGDIAKAANHFLHLLSAMPFDEGAARELEACFAQVNQPAAIAKAREKIAQARASAPDPNRPALQIVDTPNGPLACPYFL